MVFEKLVHRFVHHAASHHLGYRAECLREEIVVGRSYRLFYCLACLRANLFLMSICARIGYGKYGKDENDESYHHLHGEMARLLLRLLLEIRMHRCSLLESLLIGFLLGFLIILLLSLLLVGSLRETLLNSFLLLGILVALVGFYCFQYSFQILYLPGRSPICHTLLPHQCFGTDALLYELVETERTSLLSIMIDYKKFHLCPFNF